MRVSVFIDSMISSVLADFKAMEAPLVGLAYSFRWSREESKGEQGTTVRDAKKDARFATHPPLNLAKVLAQNLYHF